MSVPPAESLSLLHHATIFLLAAVISVPIAKRLGLGSVLGYLGAGVIIGPDALALIKNPEDIRHFAEFGVPLLLFLVGLELNPERLWAMHRPILLLGIGQVLLTSALIYPIGLFLEYSWQLSLVIALGLSLSSTAIALQILNERNLLNTPAGNADFSILLFQDLAVIPIMAFMPLLILNPVSDGTGENEFIFWKALLAIIGIIVGGRFLIRPAFRYIANTQMREIFTAFSLLLVVGIGLLMEHIHLSMALGTFLAGVLLAESEYRHELEANIRPFKGLLLGLFFIAVGMSVDLTLLQNQPLLIFGLAFALVVIKLCVLVSLAWIKRIPLRQQALFAFVLAQGGEFAFVIFGLAHTSGIMPTDTLDLLIVIVAISMAFTPILMLLEEYWLEPHLAKFGRNTQVKNELQHENAPVIIGGFGRYGQIIGRLLHANKIKTTIIDHNPDHIEYVRQYDTEVFYGDVTHLDLLRTAGADKAKLFIVAIDDREAAIHVVDMLHKHFPHLIVLARAWDVIHLYALRDHGVAHIRRETFDSALAMGKTTLLELGFATQRAEQAANTFQAHDEHTVDKLYAAHHKGEEHFISGSLQAREELEKLLEDDEEHIELDKKDD